ncbi:MAG TPA: hypothetical protein VMH85_15210 [Terriglobales bacterium]|nr:hypothetical protein [Terriglobales bacterium]
MADADQPASLLRHWTSSLHHHRTSSPPDFITASCYQRRPLLGTAQNHNLFLEVMERVRQRHGFVVVGYVVMPEHVQL